MCYQSKLRPAKGSTVEIQRFRNMAATMLWAYKRGKSEDLAARYPGMSFMTGVNLGKYEAFCAVVDILEGGLGLQQPQFRKIIFRKYFAREAARFQPPAVIYGNLLTSTKGAA